MFRDPSPPTPLRCAEGGAWLIGLALVIAGCGGGPQPPARWAVGGARLDLPAATWTYDGDDVEIRPFSPDYAQILVDGDVELHVDRAGRVYDRKRRMLAVLEPDGRLVGVDNELLGTVGGVNAAQPGKAHAWLSITPQGTVLKYEGGGAAIGAGQWLGCSASPFATQTCLLVSYLLYFEDEGERTGERAPVGIGVGIGIGVTGP